MSMKFEFSRKLSLRPLIIGAIAGFIFGIAGWVIIGKQLALLLAVLVFGFVVLYFYPNTLEKTYGYWKVDKDGIYFYNYKNWLAKIHAVLCPLSFETTRIKFNDIKSVRIVHGKHILNSSDILGGSLYAPEAIFTSLRTSYYLEVIMKDNKTIKLDLSYNVPPLNRDEEYVMGMFRFLSEKVNSNSDRLNNL